MIFRRNHYFNTTIRSSGQPALFNPLRDEVSARIRVLIHLPCPVEASQITRRLIHLVIHMSSMARCTCKIKLPTKHYQLTPDSSQTPPSYHPVQSHACDTGSDGPAGQQTRLQSQCRFRPRVAECAPRIPWGT